MNCMTSNVEMNRSHTNIWSDININAEILSHQTKVPPQSRTDNRRWGRKMINSILGVWIYQMDRSRTSFIHTNVFFSVVVLCHLVPFVWFCLSVVWLSYRYQFVWLEIEGNNRMNKMNHKIISRTYNSVWHCGANSILFLYDVHVRENKY